LIGAISKQGVEVSYHGQGTAKAACMLIVSELGSDGKEHQLWQPVEVWGKKAEQVGELDHGACGLVDRKLQSTRKDENWQTVLANFDAQPARIAQLTGEGLGLEIQHGPPTPARCDDIIAPHDLQGVPYGFVWLEIGTDLLSAEAFGMLSKQREDTLAHCPAWSSALALGASGYRRFRV